MINNISLFGDSIGKGIIYNEDKQGYAISDSGFASLFSEVNGVTVNNFSKFGCTVTKGFTILERRADSLADCDLVVLEYGGNDCDHNWNEISDNPDTEHICNTPIDAFADTYKRMIQKIKALGKKVAVLNLPPLDADKYFAWICRSNNAGNIKKWLGGSAHYIYRWQESYSNTVFEIANTMKVHFVDIRSAFLSIRNYTDYICIDGIHPNQKGHELICKTVNQAYRNAF